MHTMWEVKIKEQGIMSGKEIFIFFRHPNGLEVVGENGSTTTVYQHGSANVPATLTLTDEMFKALVDAIHKDHKPSEGKFTEGKLEGTERHLEDLRVLLKLKK